MPSKACSPQATPDIREGRGQNEGIDIAMQGPWGRTTLLREQQGAKQQGGEERERGREQWGGEEGGEGGWGEDGPGCTGPSGLCRAVDSILRAVRGLRVKGEGHLSLPCGEVGMSGRWAGTGRGFPA